MGKSGWCCTCKNRAYAEQMHDVLTKSLALCPDGGMAYGNLRSKVFSYNISRSRMNISRSRMSWHLRNNLLDTMVRAEATIGLKRFTGTYQGVPRISEVEWITPRTVL